MVTNPARCKKRYSAVEHLAYSIWLNHDPRERFMAMFTAYFDASGHGADQAPGSSLFVTGFVASVEKWLRFEERWLEHLAAYSITPPFHMTDFISGVDQYEALKNDAPKRELFLSQAVKIIKTNTRNTFSSGVVVDDLARMCREYDVGDLPREPYAFCGAQVMVRVGDWARRCVKSRRLKATDELEFVFELGDLHQGHFLKYAKERIGRLLILKEKGKCIPFQACDLVAWAHRRALRNTHLDDYTMPSAFADIMRLLPAPANGSFHDWANMEPMAKALGFRPLTSPAPTGDSKNGPQ
jgi:hypothetical protein